MDDGDSMSEGTSTFDIHRLPPRSKSFVDHWQSKPQRRSESSSSALSTASKNSQSSYYTLLSFSNAHILEDNFELSSYSLRPYELLELHPGRYIIQLPRDVVSDYVQPYFEARVDALRSMAKDKAEGFLGIVNMGGSGKKAGLSIKIGSRKGLLYNSEPGVSTDYLKQQSWQEEQNQEKHERTTNKKDQDNGKKKRKMEWKQRLMVIHEGKLRLSQHHSVSVFALASLIMIVKPLQDATNTRAFSLNSLICIRGAEHLPRPYANLSANQRIVCVKFRMEGVTQAVPAMPTPARSSAKDSPNTSRPSTRQPSPAPPLRESYHQHQSILIDQQSSQNPSPQQQNRGIQTSASPPSSYNSVLSLSPTTRSNTSSSLSSSIKSRHTSNSSSEWTGERDANLGTRTGMTAGIWGMPVNVETSRSLGIGTSIGASTSSRNVSGATDINDSGEVGGDWETIEKEKEKADEIGEWIVLDIYDDGGGPNFYVPVDFR